MLFSSKSNHFLISLLMSFWLTSACEASFFEHETCDDNAKVYLQNHWYEESEYNVASDGFNINSSIDELSHCISMDEEQVIPSKEDVSIKKHCTPSNLAMIKHIDYENYELKVTNMDQVKVNTNPPASLGSIWDNVDNTVNQYNMYISEGLTLDEIADKFGTSRQTLFLFRKKYEKQYPMLSVTSRNRFKNCEQRPVGGNIFISGDCNISMEDQQSFQETYKRVEPTKLSAVLKKIPILQIHTYAHEKERRANKQRHKNWYVYEPAQ